MVSSTGTRATSTAARVARWVVAAALVTALAGRGQRVARRSGVTDAEFARGLPGDEVVPTPLLICDRATTLDASPDVVWPWIVQLGKARGGWYLPKPLAAFLPAERRGAAAIRHELQGLKVGDVVPDWGPQPFRVVALEPGAHVVYEGVRDPVKVSGRMAVPMFSWALVLTPASDDRTRLHLRVRAWGLWRRPRLIQLGGGLIDYATGELLFAGLRQRVNR